MDQNEYNVQKFFNILTKMITGCTKSLGKFFGFERLHIIIIIRRQCSFSNVKWVACLELVPSITESVCCTIDINILCPNPFQLL